MTSSIQMLDLTSGVAGVSSALSAHPSADSLPAAPASMPSYVVSVVRKERRGYARTFPLEIGEDETMAAFMGRLKSELGASKLKTLLKKVAVFEEEAVFEAPLSSVIARAHPDLEGGVALVDVGPLTYSPLLTEAYHNAEGLGDLANLRDAFRRYESGPASARNLAIVLGWKTCKTYMIVNLGIFCALSVLVGVVVGIVCHNANLGIAVGGGLVAIIGVLVAMLVVITK